MKETVSIVLPTMNRRKDLGEFLPTLLAQTRRPEELVVVDAGQDQVRDLLEERLAGSGIALVYETSRPGTSVQRNRGVELSRGDYIFFIDDDVLLDPRYIESSLEAFSVPSARPIGGVLGTFSNPNYRDPLGRSVARVFGLTHHAGGDEARLYPAGGVRWLLQPSHVVPVPAAATGRVAYRRQCLLEEQFREFLPGYTLAEDLELSLRIARRWDLVQTPEARLFHKRSAANRGGRGDRASRVVYSHFYIFHQHMPHDPSHVAAFAWANVGLVGLALGGAVKNGQVGPVLRGLAQGYRLCVQDLK